MLIVHLCCPSQLVIAVDAPCWPTKGSARHVSSQLRPRRVTPTLQHSTPTGLSTSQQQHCLLHVQVLQQTCWYATTDKQEPNNTSPDLFNYCCNTYDVVQQCSRQQTLTLPGGFGISPPRNCFAPATAVLPTAPTTLLAPVTAAPTAAFRSGPPGLPGLPALTAPGAAAMVDTDGLHAAHKNN
jgi:hypothetical protein